MDFHEGDGRSWPDHRQGSAMVMTVEVEVEAQ